MLQAAIACTFNPGQKQIPFHLGHFTNQVNLLLADTRGVLCETLYIAVVLTTQNKIVRRVGNLKLNQIKLPHFNRVINKLNLNEDVTDRRDKVTFHTLRHTYASMLVQKGVDIYHVKELLGHSSIALTERYSHLSESTLKHAALMIQGD